MRIWIVRSFKKLAIRVDIHVIFTWLVLINDELCDYDVNGYTELFTFQQEIWVL